MKVLDAIVSLWKGMLNGYPLCCVSQFTIEVLIGFAPARKRRFIVFHSAEEVFVPCFLHRRFGHEVFTKDGVYVDLTDFLRGLGS